MVTPSLFPYLASWRVAGKAAARSLAATVALTLAACSGHQHGDGPQADEYVEDCGGAARTFASDESFVALINREAAGGFVVDDARAARLSSPAAGSALSVTMPPTFLLDVTAARPLRRPPPTLWQRLSPIGTAHAHCPGVTGENYLLRLSRQGDAAPVFTAMLSVRRYTPNAERWRRALAGRAGQTLTLTLARAVFSRGAIVEGPFVTSTPVTFTVAP
jgi:hypothetical protein